MDSFYNYRVSKSLIKIGLALIIILFSSCDKKVDPAEVLEQEFLASIVGDWEASTYEYSNSQSPDTTDIRINNHFEINSYSYSYTIHFDADSSTYYEEEYFKSDDIFCELNKMDVMMAWSIVQENDMLKLFASHHCGCIETFEIIVNSLRDVQSYISPNNLTHIGFEADLTLSNQYSETRLNNIFISTSSLTFSEDYESFSFVKIGL